MAINEKITYQGQGTFKALDGKVSFNQSSGNIITTDGTTPRVLMGNQSTFGEGFYVTKSGVNVETNTDTSNFIFNSNQNIFKIISVIYSDIFNGSTQNVSSNNTQVQTNLVTQIAHGLDHIPAFLAYVQLSGASYCLMPYTAKDIFGSTINNHATRTYSITADATNIYIILQVTQTSTSNVTIAYGGEPVKIYLLQETAS